LGFQILSFGLISLGIPYFLYKKVSQLQRDNKLRNEDEAARWGSLYELYKGKYPWFDIVMMARKLLILVGCTRLALSCPVHRRC
jgi:hypothetical protein